MSIRANDPWAQMAGLDKEGRAYVVTIVSHGTQVAFRAGVYAHASSSEWLVIARGDEGARAFIRKSSIDAITVTET